MRLSISSKIVLSSLILALFATILGGYSIYSSYYSIVKSKEIESFFIPTSSNLAQASIKSLMGSKRTITLFGTRKKEDFFAAMEQFKLHDEILITIEDTFKKHENRDDAAIVAKLLLEYRLASDNLTKYSKLAMESNYKSTELGGSFVLNALGVVKSLNIVYDSVLKTLLENVNNGEFVKDRIETINLLVKTIDSAHRITGIYAAILNSGSSGGFAGINRLSDIMDKNIIQIESQVSTPQNKKLVQDAYQEFTKTKKIISETLEEYKNFIEISKKRAEAETQVETLNAMMTDSLLKATIEASKDSTIALEYGLYITIGMLAFIFVLAIFIIIYLLKSVITPIKSFVTTVGDLTSGDGDLSKRIKSKNNDELAELAANFNKFIENVQEIIKEVKVVTDEVASSNNQLASTMEELSTTFESQAHQVTEIVTNMNSVGDITENTENSLNENLKSLNDSSNMATNGSKQLNIVKNSMEDIKSQTTTLSQTISNLSDSSSQIGDILSIINDIAEQTNLLALNAAIEAARAGDAGRGFAVVADEVRKLAERTTKATSEIENITSLLLNESNIASSEMMKTAESVAKGVVTIQEAAKGFVHVVSAINNVHSDTVNLSGELSNQHVTINNIGNSTQMMASTITESNLAVGEVNATVSHLQKRTEYLKSLIGKFKI